MLKEIKTESEKKYIRPNIRIITSMIQILMRLEIEDSFCLSPVLILLTDGMSNIAERAEAAINSIKKIRKGHTIRLSLGLRHPYNSELDSFASLGSIEYPDGSLPNICKVLSRGLICIAVEDDNICWEN